MKIKELPRSERPYEKLALYGSEKLSNSELLAIIIKTGTKNHTAIELAQRVLKLKGNTNTNNLSFLQEISIQEFMDIKGIGQIKAIQLKAICEIAKRMSRPIDDEKVILKSSEDVAKLLLDEMKYEKIEMAKVLILNNKNILLKIKDIALGGSNFAMIEPKEVLSDAVKMQAKKIILVHNHPSGDPTPSKADIKLTDRIWQACEMLGIDMLDHVVIGYDSYKSVFSEIAKRKEESHV